MTAFIGIDPGATGAVALYCPAKRIVIIEDMPTHTVKVANRSAQRVDSHRLADVLARFSDAYRVQVATIEQVAASPQMGVTSAFAFGEAFGMAKQAIAGCRIPVQLTRPQEWKSKFKLIGKDKDESRLRASQLFPEHAHLWARKKDDGRAEALLLAVYGAQT